MPSDFASEGIALDEAPDFASQGVVIEESPAPDIDPVRSDRALGPPVGEVTTLTPEQLWSTQIAAQRLDPRFAEPRPPEPTIGGLIGKGMEWINRTFKAPEEPMPAPLTPIVAPTTVEETPEVTNRRALSQRIYEAEHPVKSGVGKSAEKLLMTMAEPAGPLALAATPLAPGVMLPIWGAMGTEGSLDAIQRIQKARETGDRAAYYEAASDLLVNAPMAASPLHLKGRAAVTAPIKFERSLDALRREPIVSPETVTEGVPQPTVEIRTPENLPVKEQPLTTEAPSALYREGETVPRDVLKPEVAQEGAGEVPAISPVEEAVARGVEGGDVAAQAPSEVLLTDAAGNPAEFYSLPRLRAANARNDPQVAAAKKYYGAKTIPDLARLAKARFEEMAKPKPATAEEAEMARVRELPEGPEGEAQLVAGDIAKAVDTVDVADISGYSPVPALVRIIRRAPRDHAMKTAAEQAMQKIGQAAREQGVPLDTIKTQIADELKAVYGADAAEMAKYYFGEQPKPAPLTPEEQTAAQRQLAEEVPAAQPVDVDALTADKQAYAALKAKFAEFAAKGDMESPEFQATFKALEELKNRNKGMPPGTAPPAGAAPETGPGTGVGPGAAAPGEFAAATAEPVPIPPPTRRTVAERVRSAVDKMFSKEQGADTPIQTDVSTPLPDFQPHAKSKAIFSQPFGFERVPVLGALFGGQRRLKGNVPESVVTYHAERNVGRSIASALAQEYAWIDKPFKIKDGQIVNIGRTEPGQSLFISDVMEALQRDPNAYDLSVQQRNAFDALQALEQDFQKLGEKYGLGKVMDNEGVGVEESFDAPTTEAKTYFPRVVVEHPSTTQLRRGQAPGSKAFFEKPRMFESEAEGWSKGYRYEDSIAKRVATRAERLYKRMSDKRLADDPELGGITRKQLDQQLNEVYAEELGSGEITPERLSKIGDSIEAAGRVWQPAFFGKIFGRETAEAMNKAFPNTQSTLRHHAANINNALKGLWLGFDLGVGFIQGQGLMFHNPAVWAKSNVNSLRAMFSRRFFPEYVRRNLDPIREMSQLGSSVGRMEEMLAGLEKGELLQRIPVVKQTVGKAITPFARQFQTFLDTAKVELWKGMREVTPKEEWGRAIQSLESILTTGRMESVGVSGSRALTERVLLIAPSYYRGAANLIAAMAEKGVSGSVARRAVGSWLAGGAILYYAVAKALGMSDDDVAKRMDPRRSDFLMWRVKMGKRNTEVGFGGIFKSLLRLGGNMVKTSMEHPEDWKSLAPEKNPITRWYRGHAGPVVGATWDLFTGKDFMGRDVGITPGELSQRLMPMTARAVLDPDQPLNAVDAGASFTGLTAFERRNEAQQELGRLATRFLEKQGRPRTKMERPAYDEPTYANMRWALRTDNTKRATEVLKQLRKTRTDKQIEAAMSDYADNPFTGSADMERAFVATLNPDQRRQYLEAYRERLSELREFFKLFVKTPRR